jgi:hypothetical protein
MSRFQSFASITPFFILLNFQGDIVINRVHGQTGPTISGCPVFPADNVWNTAIDHLPVHPHSSDYINTIGVTRRVHPDFGAGLWEGGPIGIPYTVVSGTQPTVPITFDYSDESDPGPYPIPPDAAIEGGSQSSGDRHVLLVDKDNCILYETWSTYPQPDGSWTAGSGAIFDLRSNSLRPSGFTSADAAGLPILPGLVRYDEVASGEIRHALRFTAPQTKSEFVWPARHYASSLTGSDYPPMGLRFRLKASFDVSGFDPEVEVILRGLKKYGMILADNGSAWYLSGVPDARWNNDVLVSELSGIKGSDFEAIDETSLIVNVDSGQASQSAGEIVSAPTFPSGPANWKTGIPSSYTASGSISNLGHPLQYQFDWKGDGSMLSGWGGPVQSKVWTAADSYIVKARARCLVHQDVVSDWSEGLSVAISPAKVYYVATQGNCGVRSPCFSSIQEAIDSAESLSLIHITQDACDEDITFDQPKVLSLQGGWDAAFTAPVSNTPLLGLLTIYNGLLIIENMILQ